MNLASILQHPIEEIQTPPPRQSSSTSTSPILSPHAGCGVVKPSKSTTKRTQTKAACLGCRQRKSKVGILSQFRLALPCITVTDLRLVHSATETVRHVKCASKEVPNANILSKRARPSNKPPKNNSDHTRMYCRCSGIARPRRAKRSYTSSRTWTSTTLAGLSSTDQSLYRIREQVHRSPYTKDRHNITLEMHNTCRRRVVSMERTSP